MTRGKRFVLRIDRAANAVCHQVLQLLCWITGKSNFFFARAMLIVSLGCWLGTVAIGTLAISGNPKEWLLLRIAFPIALALTTAIVLGSTLTYWRYIALLEVVLPHYGKQGYLVHPADAICAIRVFELSLSALIPLAPTLAWLPARAVSTYFVWDYIPPRRGRLRRLVKRLRARLSLSLPRALPAPAPA